jgi:hypothetical protein
MSRRASESAIEQVVQWQYLTSFKAMPRAALRCGTARLFRRPMAAARAKELRMPEPRPPVSWILTPGSSYPGPCVRRIA